MEHNGVTRLTRDELPVAARQVIADNDLGHMVKAGPFLYPHQWSWDAAFISIGLAHMSVARAVTELETLFAAQWSTGMIPHIVFSDVIDYFPGFDTWGTAVAKARPPHIRTSGICQPPVHALAVELIWQIAKGNGGHDQEIAAEFVEKSLPVLHAWHAWLSRARVDAESGLVTIHHGWESGMDNSPRFDALYQRIVVPQRRELPRTDLKHAAQDERPTDAEYQRYLWLIDQMIRVKFDDEKLPDVMDFRCGDVFMTALLAVGSDSLARLSDEFGQPDLAAMERDRAEKARGAVVGSIDPSTGLCRDFDVMAGLWIDVESMASFSLLLSGGDAQLEAQQTAVLESRAWMGHPNLLYKLPPSVSLDDPNLRPRAYWRGPVWPVMNWLFAYCALTRKDLKLAHDLREAGLCQLEEGSFGEYYEPMTGETLGSPRQSWSAMAAIDWLASPRWQL